MLYVFVALDPFLLDLLHSKDFTRVGVSNEPDLTETASPEHT